MEFEYYVRKVEDGEVINGCFVLRPDIDPAARAALWAYAGETSDETIKTQTLLTLLRLDGNKAPLPPTRRKIDELKTSVTKTHHELATCNIGGNGLEEAEMIMAIAKKMGEGRDTLPLEYLAEDNKTSMSTTFGINVLLIDRFELMELLHYKALALKHGLTLDEEVD